MININIKKSVKVTGYDAIGLSAFIDFPYNGNIVQHIKTYPSNKRNYNPNTKQWELDPDFVPDFIEFLNTSIGSPEITITGRNEYCFDKTKSKAIKGNLIKVQGVKNNKRLPFNIQSDDEIQNFLHTLGITSKLFKHQIDAVRYSIEHDNMFVGDEAGAGKSLESIAISLMRSYLYDFRTTLIICGVNDLKWNFYKDIVKHMGPLGPRNVSILGMRLDKHALTKIPGKYKTEKKMNILWSDISNFSIGGLSERVKDLEELIEEKDKEKCPRFLITNIESIRDSKIVSRLNTLCRMGIIGQIIVDECHKCANPSSKQTKGLLTLKSKFRIPMTGTPMMNTPLDLWPYLSWMGIEDNNFYAFKKHYCKFGGFKNKQVMGYKNLDQLQNMLDECMIRRLQSEILDLPEKNIYEEYVEMDQLQETLYTYVRESTLLEMESMLTSANPLVQMIRMRQATGNTWTLENSLNIPQFTSVRCAKLERLKDIVKERTDNGQKIIVFTNWVQVALKLKEELKEYNPQMIHGEVKTKEKQIAEEEFQTNPDCKVLIGTIGSMGTGLNLTAANCVIFMDEPWTYSNFSQAIDRAHRIGTKGQIDIISLITKNTIDERIHNLILSKKNISDLVVDGNKKNKESIIKYLLGLIGDEELNSSNN